MANNVQIQLQATWVVSDNTLSPAPVIFTRNLNVPQLLATSWDGLEFVQVPNGTLALTLPASTIYCLYVRNLSNTNNLTLNYTPFGASSTSLLLLAGATAGAGGYFIYHQPAETAGGITAVSLTGTAVTPAEVMMAS